MVVLLQINIQIDLHRTIRVLCIRSEALSFFYLYSQTCYQILAEVVCHSCTKKLPKNNQIKCDLCKHNFHAKCCQIRSLKEFKKLRENDTDWFCNTCTDEILPFSSLNDEEFSNILTFLQIKLISQTKNQNVACAVIVSKLITPLHFATAAQFLSLKMCKSDQKLFPSALRLEMLQVFYSNSSLFVY